MRQPTTLILVLALSGCSSDEGGGPGGGTGASGGSGGGSGGSGDKAEWLGYGHDYSNSRANTVEKAISVATVPSLVERWRWDGAGVTSTPVVRGGTVYFGTWDGSALALDAATGNQVWKTQVIGPGPALHISHTPYVTDDTVYIGGLGGNLFALNRQTGEKIWPDGVVTDPVGGGVNLWSSPVVVDDLIIIGIASVQVFFAGDPPFKGNIAALDKTTGAERWRVQLTTGGSGVSVWSSAAVDTTRGTIYIGTGQQYTPPDTPYSDALVAVDYKSGQLKWGRQFTAGDNFALGRGSGVDHDVGASPNLFEVGGRALVGVGDKKGNYYGVDRESGEIVWTTTLNPGGRTGGVMATAAYHDGVVYVVANDGSSGGGAGQGTSGPARANAYALDAGTGTVIWNMPTTGCYGAVTYTNGLVLFPTIDGTAHALNAVDGAELWIVRPGLPLAGGISVSAGLLYVGYGWTWSPSAAVPGGLVAYGP